MLLLLVMTYASTDDEKLLILAQQRVNSIEEMKKCFFEFSKVQNIIFKLVSKHKNLSEKLSNASTASSHRRKLDIRRRFKNLVLDKAFSVNVLEHRNKASNTIDQKKSDHKNVFIDDKKAATIKNEIDIYLRIIDAKIKEFNSNCKPERNIINKEWLDILKATIEAYVRFKKSELALNIERKDFHIYVDIFSKMNDDDKLKFNPMMRSRIDDFEKKIESNKELEKIFTNLNSKLHSAKFW